MTTLYDYQVEARDAVLASNKGRVILPTGTGKSTIQASVIESLISKAEGHGVYVILTPRILLTNQLMSTTVNYLKSVGKTNLKLVTIHSGNGADLYDEEEVTDEDKCIFDTMQNSVCITKDAVIGELVKGMSTMSPTIVCCTYQSVSTLIYALVDLGIKAKQVLCDEAHYITEKRNFDNIVMMDSVTERIHYFTATQKTSSSTTKGLGMNNGDVYGEVIFRRIPKQMIELGRMVAPRIHSAVGEKDVNVAALITKAFDEHQQQINVDAGVEVDAKVMVCCNGTMPLEQIRNNKDLQKWANDNNVTVFAITSKYGAWKNNEKYEKRDKFLQDLRNHTGRALILHVAILTEGIDVPDMSGVLFLRDMGMCRFLQSLGRTTRMLSCDIGKTVGDRRKKFAYAIIIDIIDDAEVADQYSNLRKMTVSMREAGFDAVEPVISGYDKGVDVDNDIESTNLRERRIRQWNELNTQIDQEIEAEQIAISVYTIVNDTSKTDEEQAKELLGI